MLGNGLYVLGNGQHMSGNGLYVLGNGLYVLGNGLYVLGNGPHACIQFMKRVLIIYGEVRLGPLFILNLLGLAR